MRIAGVLGVMVVSWALALAPSCDEGVKTDEAPTTKEETEKPPPSQEEKKPAEPKPPSTGAEMPVAKPGTMTPKQAQEAFVIAEREMKSGKPNCPKVVKLLTLSIPVIAPTLTKENVPAYKALRYCARKTERWQTMLRASVALLPAGGKVAEPESIVRALAELGEFDKAMAAIKELGDKMPESRPGLLAARTLVVCKQQRFRECVVAAEKGLEYVKKADPELIGKDALRNRMLRAFAWVNLGEFDKARASFAAIGKQVKKAPPPIVVRLQKAMARADMNEVFIDPSVPPTVPLGIYHLLGREKTGFVTKLSIVNLAKRPRQLKIEAEIAGLTDKVTRSATLLPGKKRELLGLVPPLKVGLDISTIRSEKPAQVSLKVTEQTKEGDRVVFEESYPVTLLPRDYLPTYRLLGADATRMTPENIAAWITPNAKPIDGFLSKAKQRHEKKHFVGEQGPTVPQVKALFDELKSRGVTYVMDPTVNTDLVATQRTRLPVEVLESTNAQCLEGTILFATLMEAIGLRPLIVLVPGHAFVGWQTTKGDGNVAGKPLFVETTMVGNATFEQAVKVATQRAVSEINAGNHKRGVTHILSLRELRAAGFKPQPN